MFNISFSRYAALGAEDRVQVTYMPAFRTGNPLYMTSEMVTLGLK